MSPSLVLSAVHLGLVGGMVAVFFGDEQIEGWVGAAVLLVFVIVPMLIIDGLSLGVVGHMEGSNHVHHLQKVFKPFV